MMIYLFIYFPQNLAAQNARNFSLLFCNQICRFLFQGIFWFTLRMKKKKNQINIKYWKRRCPNGKSNIIVVKVKCQRKKEMGNRPKMGLLKSLKTSQSEFFLFLGT
jgi:hypothetical protein